MMKHNFKTDWKTRDKQQKHVNIIEAANRRPLKSVFALNHSFRITIAAWLTQMDSSQNVPKRQAAQ